MNERAVHPAISSWFKWPEPDPFRDGDDVMAGPHAVTDDRGEVIKYERNVCTFVVIRVHRGAKAWAATHMPRAAVVQNVCGQLIRDDIERAFNRLPAP